MWSNGPFRLFAHTYYTNSFPFTPIMSFYESFKTLKRPLFIKRNEAYLTKTITLKSNIKNTPLHKRCQVSSAQDNSIITLDDGNSISFFLPNRSSLSADKNPPQQPFKHAHNRTNQTSLNIGLYNYIVLDYSNSDNFSHHSQTHHLQVSFSSLFSQKSLQFKT